MRILIAGCGTIGTNLAAALAKEGQEIVVMDPDEEKLARLEAIDCQVRAASASSPLALEEAGIRHTDLVVATTQDDAANMAICRLAEFYRVPRRLARLRNPEFTDPDCPVPPEHFGIDQIISPEGIAVEHMVRLIQSPGTCEAVDFEHGHLSMRAVVITEDGELAGERVMDVRQQVDATFLIAAIRRGRRVVIPRGDEVLRIGDTAYLVALAGDLPLVLPAFIGEVRPARAVVIAGASVTGIQLARRLAGTLSRIVLLEPEARAAHAAAELLDELGVEVLHGSALDPELVDRVNAGAADFLCAVSDSDEANCMAALLYRRHGSGTPVVLVREPSYVDALESADINVVIDPRSLAVSALLRHIRGGRVLSVTRLLGEEAELIEVRAGRRGSAMGKPLRELRLPRGVLVVAVIRGGEPELAGGNTAIVEGDRVMLFATAGHAHTVAELFS